jgi:hypothetical protein
MLGSGDTPVLLALVLRGISTRAPPAVVSTALSVGVGVKSWHLAGIIAPLALPPINRKK